MMPQQKVYAHDSMSAAAQDWKKQQHHFMPGIGMYSGSTVRPGATMHDADGSLLHLNMLSRGNGSLVKGPQGGIHIRPGHPMHQGMAMNMLPAHLGGSASAKLGMSCHGAHMHSIHLQSHAKQNSLAASGGPKERLQKLSPPIIKHINNSQNSNFSFKKKDGKEEDLQEPQTKRAVEIETENVDEVI